MQSQNPFSDDAAEWLPDLDISDHDSPRPDSPDLDSSDLDSLDPDSPDTVSYHSLDPDHADSHSTETTRLKRWHRGVVQQVDRLCKAYFTQDRELPDDQIGLIGGREASAASSSKSGSPHPNLSDADAPDAADPHNTGTPMLNFNHSHTGLLKKAKTWRKDTLELYRELSGQIGIQNPTVTNFLSPLVKAFNERSNFYRLLVLYERAFTKDDFREAIKDAQSIIDELDNEVPIRQKLLGTIKHVSEGEDVHPDAKKFAQYLLDRHPKSMFSSHLKHRIVPNKSNRLNKIRKRLDGLNIACQNSINACRVEMLTAKDVNRRKQQYWENRELCDDNVWRMEKMDHLRWKEARILGFQSRAQFKADMQMGKCALCIERRIHEIRKKVLESAPTRLEQLLRVKAESLSGGGQPRDLNAVTLYEWDYTFCSNLSLNRNGDIRGNLVDWELLSAYFELKRTLKATISIISKLFGLKFRRIHARNTKPFQGHGNGDHGHCKVWDDEVKVYSVWDRFNDQKDFLGYLYLDLFSRENKSNMQGHCCLQAAASDQRPSSVIFMDIAKKDTKKATLLEHNQLCSLFHYFGLAIHNLVSLPKYALLPDLEKDFVEIPGVLLEQWCWEPSILKKLGQHWSWNSNNLHQVWAKEGLHAVRPRKTLNMETIQQLQVWKANNEGLEKLKECQHAVFDMGSKRWSVTTKTLGVLWRSYDEWPLVSSSLIWNRQMSDRVVPFSMDAMEALEREWEWGRRVPIPQTLCMRYMGRQTYLLINECARDLFETKFKNKLTDTFTGKQFIEMVLADSSSSTGLEKLWEFLGRCPKPFDRMVAYRSDNHSCHVNWRERHRKDRQNHAQSQNTILRFLHMDNPKEPNATTSSAVIDGDTASIMDPTIRHPVFFTNRLKKTRVGVDIPGDKCISPVAEGYVYTFDPATRHPVFFVNWLKKLPENGNGDKWSSPVAEGYISLYDWVQWKMIAGPSNPSTNISCGRDSAVTVDPETQDTEPLSGGAKKVRGESKVSGGGRNPVAAGHEFNEESLRNKDDEQSYPRPRDDGIPEPPLILAPLHREED